MTAALTQQPFFALRSMAATRNHVPWPAATCAPRRRPRTRLPWTGDWRPVGMGRNWGLILESCSLRYFAGPLKSEKS